MLYLLFLADILLILHNNVVVLLVLLPLCDILPGTGLLITELKDMPLVHLSRPILNSNICVL